MGSFVMKRLGKGHNFSLERSSARVFRSLDKFPTTFKIRVLRLAHEFLFNLACFIRRKMSLQFFNAPKIFAYVCLILHVCWFIDAGLCQSYADCCFQPLCSVHFLLLRHPNLKEYIHLCYCKANTRILSSLLFKFVIFYPWKFYGPQLNQKCILCCNPDFFCQIAVKKRVRGWKRTRRRYLQTDRVTFKAEIMFNSLKYSKYWHPYINIVDMLQKLIKYTGP